MLDRIDGLEEKIQKADDVMALLDDFVDGLRIAVDRAWVRRDTQFIALEALDYVIEELTRLYEEA